MLSSRRIYRVSTRIWLGDDESREVLWKAELRENPMIRVIKDVYLITSISKFYGHNVRSMRDL